jgi:hypothetical protein
MKAFKSELKTAISHSIRRNVSCSCQIRVRLRPLQRLRSVPSRNNNSPAFRCSCTPSVPFRISSTRKRFFRSVVTYSRNARRRSLSVLCHSVRNFSPADRLQLEACLVAIQHMLVRRKTPSVITSRDPERSSCSATGTRSIRTNWRRNVWLDDRHCRLAFRLTARRLAARSSTPATKHDPIRYSSKCPSPLWTTRWSIRRGRSPRPSRGAFC